VKKIVSAILMIVCVFSSFLLVACGDDTVTNENNTTNKNNSIENGISEDKQIVLNDVLTQINEEFSIPEDEMIVIESAEDLELYYIGIQASDIKQFAAQTTINTATDIEEIILIEAIDEDAASRVYNALDVRHSSQRDNCKSYSPELFEIVEKCSVEQRGNFVALIMSREAKGISELYNELIS